MAERNIKNQHRHLEIKPKMSRSKYVTTDRDIECKTCKCF